MWLWKYLCEYVFQSSLDRFFFIIIIIILNSLPFWLAVQALYSQYYTFYYYLFAKDTEIR